MKKILKLYFMSFILICLLCNTGISANSANHENKPLELWVPYNPEKSNVNQDISRQNVFVEQGLLENIKKNTYYKKQKPEKPAYDYHINSLNFYGSVKNNIANISGVYRIHKNTDDWTLIPIISKKAGLSAAYLDGKQALLQPLNSIKNSKIYKKSLNNQNNYYYYLAIKAKGEHVLKINFTKNIKTDPNNRNLKSFSFLVPQAPILKLECSVNKENLFFNVPTSAISKVIGEKGNTKLIVNYSPTNLVEVKWMPKSSIATKENTQELKLPPSVKATTYSKIETGRGMLKGSFMSQIDIRRSPIDKFNLYIPDGIEIDTITLKGYDLVDPYPDIINNILPIELTTKADGKLIFGISYRQNFDSPSFKTKIPAITFMNTGIEREVGYVAILETTNIETTIEKSKNSNNYREIDSTELKGYLQGLKPSIAFKYNKSKEKINDIPFDIDLNVIRHKDIAVYEATIEQLNIDSVISKEGDILNKAVYNIKNTRKQFLEVKLPENSSIWSVFVNDKPVKPALKEKNLYAIPLLKSSSTEKGGKSFPIEIVYLTEKKGFLPLVAFGLSEFNAIESELYINSIRWNIYSPEGIKIYPFGMFSNLQREKSPRYRHIVNSSFDKVQAPIVFEQEKRKSKKSIAQELYKGLGGSRQSYLSDELKEEHIPPAPIYRSKKIGKLPVYLNLPLVGKPTCFYQISFEADKSPYILAFAINSGLLKFIFAIFAIGLARLSLKFYREKGFKSYLFLVSALVGIYLTYLVIGAWLILIFFAGLIYFLFKKFKSKIQIKQRKKTVMAFLLPALMLFGLIVSLLFNFFFIYIILMFILGFLALFGLILFLIIKFILKKFSSKKQKILSNQEENLKEEGQN